MNKFAEYYDLCFNIFKIILCVSTGRDIELKVELPDPETWRSDEVKEVNPSPNVESTIPALHLIVSVPELVTVIANDVNWSPDVGVILAAMETVLVVVKDCFEVPVIVESVLDVNVQLTL